MLNKNLINTLKNLFPLFQREFDKNEINNIDNLYLDIDYLLKSLINESNEITIYLILKLKKEVINILKLLIFELIIYIKPKKEVTIVFEGLVPKYKFSYNLNKNIYYKNKINDVVTNFMELIKNLKLKNNKDYLKLEEIDSFSDFMNYIIEEINLYIQEIKEKYFNHLDFKIDSNENIGEINHKIFNKITGLNNLDYHHAIVGDINNFLIYPLHNNLNNINIFSLVPYKNNIIKTNDYPFFINKLEVFSLDQLKIYLALFFENNDNITQIFKDISFLVWLLGNKYIPPLFGFNNNSFNLILDKLKELYKEGLSLIKDNQINIKSFKLFLKKVNESRYEFLDGLTWLYSDLINNYLSKQRFKNPKKNLKFNWTYEYYKNNENINDNYDENNYISKVKNCLYKIKKYICISGFKKNKGKIYYYDTYFKKDYNINNIIKEYLDILNWFLLYFSFENKNNSEFYNLNSSPLIEDVINYDNSEYNYNNVENGFKFNFKNQIFNTYLKRNFNFLSKKDKLEFDNFKEIYYKEDNTTPVSNLNITNIIIIDKFIDYEQNLKRYNTNNIIPNCSKSNSNNFFLEKLKDLSVKRIDINNEDDNDIKTNYFQISKNINEDQIIDDINQYINNIKNSMYLCNLNNNSNNSIILINSMDKNKALNSNNIYYINQGDTKKEKLLNYCKFFNISFYKPTNLVKFNKKKYCIFFNKIYNKTVLNSQINIDTPIYNYNYNLNIGIDLNNFSILLKRDNNVNILENINLNKNLLDYEINWIYINSDFFKYWGLEDKELYFYYILSSFNVKKEFKGEHFELLNHSYSLGLNLFQKWILKNKEILYVDNNYIKFEIYDKSESKFVYNKNNYKVYLNNNILKFLKDYLNKFDFINKLYNIKNYVKQNLYFESISIRKIFSENCNFLMIKVILFLNKYFKVERTFTKLPLINNECYCINNIEVVKQICSKKEISNNILWNTNNSLNIIPINNLIEHQIGDLVINISNKNSIGFGNYGFIIRIFKKYYEVKFFSNLYKDINSLNSSYFVNYFDLINIKNYHISQDINLIDNNIFIFKEFN